MWTKARSFVLSGVFATGFITAVKPDNETGLVHFSRQGVMI